MKKCDCYDVSEEIVGWYTPNSPKIVLKSRCFGTRERDECSCGGDRSKCDFYPEVREKARMSLLSYSNDNAVAIGSDIYKSDFYSTVTINTDKLELYDKDLGIEINIPNDILSKIETIEVNGYKFIKENKYE